MAFALPFLSRRLFVEKTRLLVLWDFPDWRPGWRVCLRGVVCHVSLFSAPPMVNLVVAEALSDSELCVVPGRRVPGAAPNPGAESWAVTGFRFRGPSLFSTKFPTQPGADVGVFARIWGFIRGCKVVALKSCPSLLSEPGFFGKELPPRLFGDPGSLFVHGQQDKCFIVSPLCTSFWNNSLVS